MRVVVGIFEQRTHTPTPEKLVLPLHLSKRIPIPKSLTVAPHIIHNRAGDTTLRVIIVEVQTPETGVGIVVVQSRFGTHSIDVAILTNSRSVVSHLPIRQNTLISERILAIGIDILRVKSHTYPLCQTHIHTYGGICQRKTAGTHLRTDMHFLTFPEIRFSRSEIHISRTAELTCRLPNIGFLSVVERNLLHIIQRKTPQINLPVLRITYLYPIVIHRRMLAAHRAHVDGLDTSHSAIVFKLHTRKITQRICHRKGVKSL